jgi:hypothetical protein
MLPHFPPPHLESTLSVLHRDADQKFYKSPKALPYDLAMKSSTADGCILFCNSRTDGDVGTLLDRSPKFALVVDRCGTVRICIENQVAERRCHPRSDRVTASAVLCMLYDAQLRPFLHCLTQHRSHAIPASVVNHN